MCSLDTHLTEMDRRHGVLARWKPGDKQYEEMRSCLLKENIMRVRATLWSCIVKRHYLLRMKAKYAGIWHILNPTKHFNVDFNTDGQKIAKKLCSSISKETKVARRLLEDYNAASSELSPGDPLPSLQDVLSLKSDFWVQDYPSVPEERVPWRTREEIIQSYLTMKRSEEELTILKSDMICTISYWFHRIQSIVNQLKTQEHCQSSYIRGASSILRRMKMNSELQCHKAIAMFSRFIVIPHDITIEYEGFSKIEEDESDSEFECDSDEEDSS